MAFFEEFEKHFINNFDVWFEQQIFANDFLTAGIFTVLSTFALYLLRHVPARIYRAIVSRSTVSVVVNNDNRFFVPITEKLNRDSIPFLSRFLTLDNDKITIGFSNSISFFGGKLVKVSRVEKESDSREFKQSITITFLSLGRAKIEQIFRDFIVEQSKKNQDQTPVFISNSNWFNHMTELPKRTRESLFVPEETLDRIESRIKFFMENKGWYRKRGIPYKYSILLHGEPGTGKTSLARYIAGHVDRNLIMMDLNALKNVARFVSSFQREEEYDDYTGEFVTTDTETQFIGVIEDIDGQTMNLNREDEGFQNARGGPVQISFSEILNAIDGINAPDDFILIATTNHLDKIDPALKRKGRFDDVIEIGKLEEDDIRRMLNFYFDDYFKWELHPKGKIPPRTGAEVQDIILTNIDSAGKALLALQKTPVGPKQTESINTENAVSTTKENDNGDQEED